MERPVRSTKVQEAEIYVAWIRLILVAFNSFVYALFIFPSGIPWLAWTIIGVANAYSAGFALWYNRVPASLKSSFWTTGTDWVLIVLWLFASGGPTSPFFMVWLVSIAAIAYRFGPKETGIATAIYMVSEAILLTYWGTLLTPLGITRVAYIGLSGAIGSSMAGVNLQARFQTKKWYSAQKEIASQAAQLTAVTESVPGIVMRLDLEGNIEFINRVSPGFDRDQIIGQPATMFVPQEDAGVLTNALEQVRATGEPANYRINAPTGEGLRTFQSSMGPIVEAGKIVGAVIHTNDITEQLQQAKEAEDARLSEARMAQLEEQDKFRRNLLNGISHELNTPLTPLKLQLYLLEKQIGDSPALDILQRNVSRLQGLVADLLDVARMDNAELTLRPVQSELGVLLQDAVDTFSPMAEANNVKLTLRADADLVGVFDPLRISQILFNLVSNSIKFGAQNVFIEASQGTDLVCVVRDDGPGFTDEQRGDLFQPFKQIHSSKIADQPGTGLGLYLSRKIAEAHGATLDADPGDKVAFRLVLPSAEVSP